VDAATRSRSDEIWHARGLVRADQKPDAMMDRPYANHSIRSTSPVDAVSHHFVRSTRKLQPQGTTYMSQLPRIIGLILSWNRAR
jgi:hypothetical protein